MATETIENVAHDDTPNREIHEQLGRKYSAGFITEIESDSLPPGLDEDTIRALSAKKEEPEWMTQWRLDAYRHFLTMPMPDWAKLEIAPIDLQALSYYSAPKGPKYASLDDVPKELLDTYDKLGVPLHERAKLAGVAVDAVFDSVSVGTTFRKELAEIEERYGVMIEVAPDGEQEGARMSVEVSGPPPAYTPRFEAPIQEIEEDFVEDEIEARDLFGLEATERRANGIEECLAVDHGYLRVVEG